MNKKITLSIALMLMANANAAEYPTIDDLNKATTDINTRTEEVGAANLAAGIADNAVQTHNLSGKIDDAKDDINLRTEEVGAANLAADIADNAFQTQHLTGKINDGVNTLKGEIGTGVNTLKGELKTEMDANTGQIQKDIYLQTAALTDASEKLATKAVNDTNNNINAAATEIMGNSDANRDILYAQNAADTKHLSNQNKHLQRSFDELQAQSFGNPALVAIREGNKLMDTMQQNAQQNGKVDLTLNNPIANNNVIMDYASPSLSGALGTSMPGMSMPITMDLSGNTISTQLSPSFASSNAANASAMGDTTTNAVYNNFNDTDNNSINTTTHETTYNHSLNTSGGLN